MRVVDEPRKGLVVARETGRRQPPATCSPTSTPTAARRCAGSSGSSGGFEQHPAVVGVTGPYRFYDWDWSGRALIRAYDLVVAPPTHLLVHYGFGAGAIFYGGNFAVRRAALERIGGFDRTIEFHGEDTNLGRRLTPLGPIDARAATAGSARRRGAIGRWGSARCSASTSATSGPRSCAIVRRTRNHLDVRT